MSRNRVAALPLILGIGAAILAPPAHASDAAISATATAVRAE